MTDECPVCGQPVHDSPAIVIDNEVFMNNAYHAGRVWTFMCRRCKGQLLRDPERYVGKHPARGSAAVTHCEPPGGRSDP